MSSKIQIRRGTSTEWTSADPVLAMGELGYETNTQKLKIGNNVTPWTQLQYLNLGGSGGGTGSQGIQGIQGTGANVKGDQGVQGIQGIEGPIGIQGIQGIEGFQGFQGILGNEGAQGIQGIQGTEGEVGVGFIFRNDWQSNVAYITNDVVLYNFNSWICKNNNTSDPPGNSPLSWGLFVPRGSQGIQGIQGPAGSGTGGEGGEGGQGIQGIQGAVGAQGTRGLDTIVADILPDTSETRNIGSPTLKFKNIYLSSDAVYLGNSKVSVGPTNFLELSKNTIVTSEVVVSVTYNTNSTVVFTNVENTSDLYNILDSLATNSSLIGTLSDNSKTARIGLIGYSTRVDGTTGKTNFTLPVDSAAPVQTNFTAIEIIRPIGSFLIPGPYLNDLEAANAGVAIGGQYYDAIGAVFVRLA